MFRKVSTCAVVAFAGTFVLKAAASCVSVKWRLAHKSWAVKHKAVCCTRASLFVDWVNGTQQYMLNTRMSMMQAIKTWFADVLHLSQADKVVLCM